MPFKNPEERKDYMRNYMRARRKAQKGGEQQMEEVKPAVKPKTCYIVKRPFQGDRLYQVGERIPSEVAESWLNLRALLNLEWLEKVAE